MKKEKRFKGVQNLAAKFSFRTPNSDLVAVGMFRACWILSSN